ncbi:MAG: ABC transporter permease [Dehalococcoidia bacterium]|nr:ABC transporter permease [Dehalococcoidia bacterium]
MTYAEVPGAALEQLAVRPAPSFRVLRRLARRPVAVIALAVILTVYLAGILAPWVAPYSFTDTDFQHRLAGPTWDHPLGTDLLGRDMLSRAIWSAQTTVIVSGAAVLTGGLVLGVTLGLLSGYAGGRLDSVIMRVADAVYSVPTILLLLIITATLRDKVVTVFSDIEDFTGIHGLVSSGAPSYFLVFGALSVFGWVGMARLVRSQVLSLREAQYVLAARAAGASTARILFRHLLPNVTNLLVVALTLSLGAAAGAEVALTWLGIGVQSPHPSFGAMIFQASALTTLRAHPHLIIVPSVVIASLMLSFNLLGDVLTDVLSPRRR